MGFNQGIGNQIHPTAQISDNVQLGNHNYIGKNVVISGFKGSDSGKINIGDCNFIHDNTRILMGPEGLSIGDWNVFHNSMLVMGDQRMLIGHNCWFGQNTILDSAGGLFIGNGVRVGMYSQIWTHVASGELIEGCSLFAKKPTQIEDDVWLVGSCSVSAGIALGRRAIFLNGSLITKNAEPNKVYRGSPAKLVEGAQYYQDVSLDDKLEMMHTWAKDFAEQFSDEVTVTYNESSREIFINSTNGESLIIGITRSERPKSDSTTYFDVADKVYTKKLTHLERRFYRSIFDHKARFLPVE